MYWKRISNLSVNYSLMVFDCIKCKGRLHCGLPRCPIFDKIKFKNEIKLSKDFRSVTNGSFIGWHGYPKVYAGVLAPFKRINPQGPEDWINGKSIIDVMSYRSSLINSRKPVNVKDLKGFSEFVQFSALSSKPLSVDVSLKKVPEFKITYNLHAQPFGPASDVNSLIVNDDPKMVKPVSKVFYDADLNAVDAILALKSGGVDEFKISSLLSAGVIGVERSRKLVPTRWSITATDDVIGKQFISEVKGFEIIDYFVVFNGRLFGNIFTIILLPRFWSFELFELWFPGSVFAGDKLQVSSDFEGFFGRKKYAFNTTGGYYAARLPVVEWLAINKLQASVLVIRQVTKDYYMPLGVWVVREAVRKALLNPKRFSDFKLVKTYVERLTGFDLRRSKLFNSKQTTLSHFL